MAFLVLASLLSAGCVAPSEAPARSGNSSWTVSLGLGLELSTQGESAYGVEQSVLDDWQSRVLQWFDSLEPECEYSENLGTLLNASLGQYDFAESINLMVYNCHNWWDQAHNDARDSAHGETENETFAALIASASAAANDTILHMSGTAPGNEVLAVQIMGKLMDMLHGDILALETAQTYFDKYHQTGDLQHLATAFVQPMNLRSEAQTISRIIGQFPTGTLHCALLDDEAFVLALSEQMNWIDDQLPMYKNQTMMRKGGIQHFDGRYEIVHRPLVLAALEHEWWPLLVFKSIDLAWTESFFEIYRNERLPDQDEAAFLVDRARSRTDSPFVDHTLRIFREKVVSADDWDQRLMMAAGALALDQVDPRLGDIVQCDQS